MNAPRHLRARLGPLAAALLAGAGAVRAEPTLIAVGQGQAWVREFFPPSGAKDIDRIVWNFDELKPRQEGKEEDNGEE